MVLHERVAFAAKSADLRRIHTWLLSLLRPEDINEVDADGRTALNLCAKGFDNHGPPEDEIDYYVTAVKMILAQGADVNLADKNGWTPLHHACDSQRFGIAVIPALLAAGANVNAKTWGVREYACGVVAPVQTPLATAIDWFRCRDHQTGSSNLDCTRTGLEIVSILLRRGASLDDCWAGATAENLLRHIEDRTTPAMELWFGNDMWIAEISSDLSQNEDFLACKRLIKNVRCEPRKTVLTLRALANKGRAQTTDPILNFLVGVPDGVAGNVLSFWPPAARYYEVRRPGTGQVPFRPYREPWVVEGNRWTNIYHSISASLAHNGKSFEELRLEDYELGRDAGRWWPGGMLQVTKASSTSSFENLAADLETLRLI